MGVSMEHSCFVCSVDNPERIFSGRSAIFGNRYVGPPKRAHGGLAVGALTCPALRLAVADGMIDPVVTSVSGRLRAPVPLETPLEMGAVASERGFDVTMHDGGTDYLNGKVDIRDIPTVPGSTIKEPPENLAEDLAELRKLASADLSGPTLVEQYYQHCHDAGVSDNIDCYGCSERPHALKLHNRATEGGDLWTRWATEPEHVDSSDRLAVAIVTAALDCSNLWVLMARESDLGVGLRRDDKKLWITGTHTVHFLRVPPVDAEYQVLTRFLQQDGRKGFTMAALLDSDATPYAVAEATSILINVPEEMAY